MNDFDNNTSESVIKRIETGKVLFNDEKNKPRIPLEIIKTTVRLFYKDKSINVKDGHKIVIGDKTYHYYAQYNSGKTTVPWYGVSNSVMADLENNKISGIILIYIKTENGKIGNGRINSRYLVKLPNSDEIKKYSKYDEKNNRFLLNFSEFKSDETYVIEVENSQLKMRCRPN